METKRQAALFLFLCFLLILMTKSSSAVDHKPEGNTPSILAIYWNGEEGDLETICATAEHNIVSIEFLGEFGHGQIPVLDLASHCNTRRDHIRCEALSKAMEACQERGIKVLLSLGNHSPATAENVNSFIMESGDDGLYWGAIAIATREFENPGRRIYLGMSLDMDGAIKTDTCEFIWVDWFNNNPSHVTSNLHVFLGLPPAVYEESQNSDFVSDHLLAFHMLQILNYLVVVIWLAIKLHKA